jgi:small subunit ribosomal protein S20
VNQSFEPRIAYLAGIPRPPIDKAGVDANNTRLFEGPAASGCPENGPELNGIHDVANIKSARKRARQAEKTRLHNKGLRSRMRTHIKAVITAVQQGNLELAQTAYKDAVPVIDSMINKGIVTKNKAARHKSRLNKMVKALSA